MKKIIQNFIKFPSRAAAGLVFIYQRVLSPDHGPLAARFPYGYCRHYPSCSEYARQSLIRFGLIKGGWLSAKRLARCHPWAKPTIDLIPN